MLNISRWKLEFPINFINTILTIPKNIITGHFITKLDIKGCSVAITPLGLSYKKNLSALIVVKKEHKGIHSSFIDTKQYGLHFDFLEKLIWMTTSIKLSILKRSDLHKTLKNDALTFFTT